MIVALILLEIYSYSIIFQFFIIYKDYSIYIIIMMKKKIYIIGALKNAEITSIAAELRPNYDVFDPL